MNENYLFNDIESVKFNHVGEEFENIQGEDNILIRDDNYATKRSAKHLYSRSINPIQKTSGNSLKSPVSVVSNNTVYDYLIQFKEKNNALQLRLNDLSKVKLDMEEKNKRIFE